MIISPGATSQSITVQVVDDAGLAVTGLLAATFPTTSYERAAEALVGITLSDLAALTSAWNSGGVKEVGGGYYRLDPPDAAWATASRVRIIGEATGKHILYPVITVMNVPADVQTIKTQAVTAVAGVTFPTSIASPTNITAGTITTVTTTTNLTNAPTAGDFTGAMKTSLNAATPASVQNISAQTGDSYARLGAAGAGLTALGDARLANLDATVSSRSIYAGADTSGTATLLARIPGTVQPQTGDSFARLGAAGAGLTNLGDARLANLDTAVSGRASATVAPSWYTGSSLTVQAIVNGVWDEPIASHLVAGTTGKTLSLGITATDPLLNAAGGYSSPSIGWEIAQTYAHLGSVTVTYVSPVQPLPGTLLFYRGSAYTTTTGRQIVIAIPPAVSNLTGVVRVELRWSTVTLASTAISNPGVSGQSVTFEADAVITAAWLEFDGAFSLWAIAADAHQNLLDVIGRVTVLNAS